jgi:hypothetical protein
MLHKYTLELLQSTTTIGMRKEIKKKSKTVEKKVSICHFGLEVLLCMTLG